MYKNLVKTEDLETKISHLRRFPVTGRLFSNLPIIYPSSKTSPSRRFKFNFEVPSSQGINRFIFDPSYYQSINQYDPVKVMSPSSPLPIRNQINPNTRHSSAEHPNINPKNIRQPPRPRPHLPKPLRPTPRDSRLSQKARRLASNKRHSPQRRQLVN